MNIVEFSLIIKEPKNNRYSETKYMSECELSKWIRYCKDKDIKILGMNRRSISEIFMDNSDMVKHGWL